MPSTSAGPRVLSVNLARVAPNPFKETRATGIDKVPVLEPVMVRAPGTKRDGLGSGLVGDAIGDRANHGGDEQAVYAYSREELDYWEEVLGRALPSGTFGENITTKEFDVSDALIGERWLIGEEVELQVTCPRIPCATFRGWLNEPGWLKTFTKAAIPGAYLRVITPGFISHGDPVRVVHRPDHDVTVAAVFRALTLEPDLLPSILAAVELPTEAQDEYAGEDE